MADVSIEVPRPARPTYGLRTLYDVPVPMRDGVRLSADVYLPDAAGPFPTILERTPYDNGDPQFVERAVFYAARGYAFVISDCRGRFDSEGVFYAWHNEAADGFDTHEWIGAQPWCNGQLGTVGSSYDGLTQWLPARHRSRFLRAMVPSVCPSDFWHQDNYLGGAFALALNAAWALSYNSRSSSHAPVQSWTELAWSLPLVEIPGRAGRSIPFYEDWLRHPAYDSYWAEISNHGRYGEMDVPVLNLAGWYDAHAGAACLNYAGMVTGARSETARRSQRLVIGPWSHHLEASTVCGQVDFGPGSRLGLRELELAFFDHHLRGVPDTLGQVGGPAPVRIFRMGDGTWRDETAWPLARTEPTPFYIHSRGGAGRLRSDGRLKRTAAEEAEPPDEYVYDPANPVLTWGGNHSLLREGITVGPYDQRLIEAREDVLTYTSDGLAEPLEVTGPVTLVLYASSSVPDTDFTARLCDVYPDGRSLNLCEGVLRARYRDSWSEPALMTPGSVYRLVIDLGVTSCLFLAGHRIRLDISSSNFPRIDRNLNTGGPIGFDTEWRIAHQLVHHGEDHPSHLILPVIPP